MLTVIAVKSGDVSDSLTFNVSLHVPNSAVKHKLELPAWLS